MSVIDIRTRQEIKPAPSDSERRGLDRDRSVSRRDRCNERRRARRAKYSSPELDIARLTAELSAS